MEKIHVKSPIFGTNENIEITVGCFRKFSTSRFTAENDLFQANSKLKDSIEVVNFDVSASPDMDKATSNESIGNQMSETVVPSSDQIVEFGLTLADSEIIVPSSDPIEIAAGTRSQSKHTPDINTGPVTQSDETNQILREMDMTKFKEMQESESSLNALWLKAKQNNSRYCISNDLLYERS